jgi:hypothetical protein
LVINAFFAAGGGGAHALSAGRGDAVVRNQPRDIRLSAGWR